MTVEETTKLTSTNEENRANQLITEGWTLLLLQPIISDGDHFVRYHLGWQKNAENKPVPSLSSMIPGVTIMK
jgi:hypothetical protein